MALINFKDVWEMYRIRFFETRRTSWESFWALKDINFKVEQGETLGIIGENGAGKSTVLKLIAGLLKPDRGEVKIQGKVSGLLELGAGFQPELTGLENIFLNAGLFGLSKKQIEEKREEIIQFAALGKFIHAPVKCYSQGMFVRLAFAIAVHVDPDIMLIDDTLAVGDEYFQKKCIQKIFMLKEQGKTIVFVTHDMNLLRQLCRRALLLKEGRLLKDGAVDPVVLTALQVLGDKKGIATIQQEEALRLVFNNGRLFFNNQDVLLTPGLGMHTVLRVANKWYSSQDADWEVEKRDDHRLVVIGRFYGLDVLQIWQIEIIPKNEVRWQVTLDVKGPLLIQEFCANIMLTRNYTHWFTTLEKGMFFSQPQASWNWQSCFDNSTIRKCIGVYDLRALPQSIPLLSFQQFGLAESQIYNCDDFLNCRMLQYKATFKSNEDQAKTGRLEVFSGRITFDPPDLDNFLQQIDEEFVLEKGSLKLVFDRGRLMIAWEGVRVTKSDHLSVSFFTHGRWYSSTSARWEFKKENDKKIVAKGVWHGLSLVQLWEIEILNESSFSLHINMRIDEEIVLEQQTVFLKCLSDYRYWFSRDSSGEFPEHFSEVFRDAVQGCILGGVAGLSTGGLDLPMVSLKYAEDLPTLAKIGNSDFYNASRELRIERVEPEEKAKFTKGFYSCFDIEVHLDKKEFTPLIKKTELSFDEKTKIVFDNGCCRLYRGNHELTKKLGFYTSLRCGGWWYDSFSFAKWKVLEKTNDWIRASGEWLDLPIRQDWEISLMGKNNILFVVFMTVLKGLEVDRLQANLMLSEKYCEWFGNETKGVFPDFRKDTSDDWDILMSQSNHQGKSGFFVGVSETKKPILPLILPQINFFPDERKNGWMLNIVNSDVYLRGRVLQYVNREKIKLLPGRFLFFKGQIIIPETSTS